MFPPRGFKTFVKAHGLGGLVIAAACPTGPGPVYRQESRRGQVSGQLDARACPGKMREARVTASRGASWWEQEPARPVVSRPGEKVQAGQRGRSSVRRGAVGDGKRVVARLTAAPQRCPRPQNLGMWRLVREPAGVMNLGPSGWGAHPGSSAGPTPPGVLTRGRQGRLGPGGRVTMEAVWGDTPTLGGQRGGLCRRSRDGATHARGQGPREAGRGQGAGSDLT